MLSIPLVTPADVSRWISALDQDMPILLADIEAGRTQFGRRLKQLHTEWIHRSACRYWQEDFAGAKEALGFAVDAYAALLTYCKSAGDYRHAPAHEFVPLLLPLIARGAPDPHLLEAGAARPLATVGPSYFELLSLETARAMQTRAAGVLRLDSAIPVGFHAHARLAQAVFTGDSSAIERAFVDCMSEFAENAEASGDRGTPLAVFDLETAGLLALHHYLHPNASLSVSRDSRCLPVLWEGA